MSGLHGHVLGHVVRRGVEAVQSHFSEDYLQQLQSDAELYENAGQEVQPYEMLPIVITGLLTILVMASIKYTIGEVMASLAMIESRTATAIIEDKPPAYADEPDAPIEKEPLVPADAEADVEVTLIKNKPITGSVRATMGHLHQVGGFFGKWRGARLSILYHVLHSAAANFLSSMLGFGLLGHALIYIFVSVGLARIHMAWTHAMIAYPSKQPFWRRIVPRKQCKAILLPSFVFAVAQQASFLLPTAVAFAVGLPNIQQEHIMNAANDKDCGAVALMVIRVLAVPATALFVAFAILLPAAVTLTRIEATLLPENEETIVPFDRMAILGNIDTTARGSSKKLFVEAWRSFDRAARWRLIKVYLKLFASYFFIALVGLHLVATELYLLGGERIAIFAKSASAQLQLMAIEQAQAQQEAN